MFVLKKNTQFKKTRKNIKLKSKTFNPSDI
jgi:hypothetical protein